MIKLSVLLITNVYALITLRPNSTEMEIMIEHSRYSMNEDQLSILYYRQKYTYDQKIYIYDSETEQQPQQISRLEQYRELNSSESEQLGCYIEKEKVVVDPLAEQTVEDSPSLFSSMVTTSDGMIYILSQNYHLAQIAVTNSSENDTATIVSAGWTKMNQNLSSHFDFGLQPGSITFSNPLLVYNSKANLVYVFSPLGAIQFKVGQENSSTPINEFKKRKVIYSAQYVKALNLVLLACGAEGVDMYEVRDDILFFIKTMSPSLGYKRFDGFPEEVNIVDVNVDVYRTALAALDSKHGIYFFQIHVPSRPQRQTFEIPLKNGWAFNIYQRTLVVAFRSIDEAFTVVTEIFVDYDNGEYYINNLFTQPSEATDILMTQQYAIVMGNENNFVFKHSVFNGFTNISNMPMTTFQQTHVSQASISQINNTKYLIALGMNTIRIYEYFEQSLSLNCQMKPQKVNLAIEFFSPLQGKINIDPFRKIQYVHFVYMQVEEVLVDSQNKNLAIGLGVGVNHCFDNKLTLGLLTILFLGLCYWYRAKKRLQRKKQKYSSYQDIEVIEAVQD